MDTYTYIYIYIYVYTHTHALYSGHRSDGREPRPAVLGRGICVYIYIYIYIERERERYTYIYIYIYIHVLLWLLEREPSWVSLEFKCKQLVERRLGDEGAHMTSQYRQADLPIFGRGDAAVGDPHRARI